MMWSADNRMKQLGFFTFQAHLKKHFSLFFGHFSLFFLPLHTNSHAKSQMNKSKVTDIIRINAKALLLLLLSLIMSNSILAIEPDSIWYDSITNVRTHLQRPDTLTPYTCSLHFCGKNKNGSSKAPGLQALIEDLSINALVLGWDHFVTDREWARITNATLRQNLSGGWVWDNDSFSGNQFAHPYHGSMFYNTAREHGLSYGVSLLYPLAGSLTWELFCETNRPAINDFLSTGIGGAAIGEVTHRLSDIFFDDTKQGPQRVVREIIGSFLNPVRGIHRIMSGEMFRVNRFNAGKKEEPMPYTFQIGTGGRYIYDRAPIHPRTGMRYYETIPYIDFRFTYGNHFNHLDEGKSPRAYDYFELYSLVNFDPDQPTVGELDIRGRIGSLQYQFPHQWKLDLGFYQNIKYIDHYSKEDNEAPGNLALISEAASFGVGLFFERPYSPPFWGGKKGATLTHDFMLSAVPLGGCAADYYPFRRYNFGTGTSIRYRFQFTLNRRFSIGNDFYFMRLFILKGKTPEKLALYTSDEHRYKKEMEDGINAWGDKGEQSIFQNRLYFQCHFSRNLHLTLQHEFNLRHGNYRYYPSITGKSHEWKAGVSYAL